MTLTNASGRSRSTPLRKGEAFASKERERPVTRARTRLKTVVPSLALGTPCYPAAAHAAMVEGRVARRGGPRCGAVLPVPSSPAVYPRAVMREVPEPPIVELRR